jgi:hypothetical protein
LAAFYRAWECSKFLHRASADIIRALEAGERWRADIRATRGAPRVVELSRETLLYLPQAGGEVRYQFTNGTVFRRGVAPTNAAPLLLRVKQCRFAPEARPGLTAWRWDVELLSTQRVVHVKPLLTFLAVPDANQGKPQIPNPKPQ